ncbi:HAD-IC family P-type ATPase [Massilia sp. CCM 8733]|uniref:HAD-IC family P-type ATPase n=1 Tax=Massilia mucilaginosa TaxID=2609282 RepID=A0ABX0NVG2_9BURK|nr:HAD-IC family P-type ATPase [Massilia mucilaginosa]NHZ90781.1 HAD-IC family P-type ATPase [Massilia mucilaginosa]
MTLPADKQWHAMSTAAVLEELHAGPAGLGIEEAARRQARCGPNRMPAPARPGRLMVFLRQFNNALIYVLIACAAITALLQHWIDSAVIVAVVLVNAVIGFAQEGKTEKAMDAIRRMLAPVATVLRGGERMSVPGDALVAGDIVLVEAGDKVPADLRLLTAHGVSVQEAVLTGESATVDKQCGPVAAGAALGERSCMLFSGTIVATGQGHGVVVATGTATQIGHIGGMLGAVEQPATPLVEQMSVLSRWLTALILLVASLLLLYGYVVGGQAFGEIFMVVVGLSVAAIPEGLPAVMTITLALGVQSMARRNAIVRRLPAIEAIGSVSVICTDKTGTLTRNEMVVATVVTDRHVLTVDGDGYAPAGVLRLDTAQVDAAEYAVLDELAMAAALCNDAELACRDDAWTVEGDPMEGALLAFAGKLGVEGRAARRAWRRTDAIAFDARHRFMATLQHDHAQHASVYVKGAPERILGMCRAQRAAGGASEALDRAYWEGRAEAIAGCGQRVLAFAALAVADDKTVLAHADVEGALTMLGMVGMIDPPRPEAVAAIAQCHLAGIAVKMITGDHAKTAAAIGRQVGLVHHSAVLTGADLDRMDDAALRGAVLACDIFARTSPEHKLRLVMALQAQGMSVAMTGDGVNDAPALKRADAGIAMGRKGSEAAKEAAQLVLADDNFASIVAAVREGRTVYDNIKKVISWTLPTNAGEAATIVVALLFGMTLPVTPIQILWVNLITASTLGVALAFEPTEENTMRRPPRRRSESLIGAALAWHIVLVALLFLAGVFSIFSYALARGYPIELARTMALNTLVVMEIFHLFFIRNIYGTSLTWKALRGTRAVWITIAIVTVAQFGITYLAPMQALFGTRAIGVADGVLIVGVGIALFAIVEIEKQIRLRL